MFRKAQLRLFAIITSILVAVFITVLILINILTKSYMQKQSREVLQQVAVGTEYDEKTETFSFIRPDNSDFKQHRPPELPTEEPTAETESGGAVTERKTAVTGQQQESTQEEEIYTGGEKEESAEKTTSKEKSAEEATEKPTEKTTKSTEQETKSTQTESVAKAKTEKPRETEKPTEKQKEAEKPTRENIQPSTENRNNNDFQQRPTENYGGFDEKPFDRREYEKPFENQPPEDDFRNDDFPDRNDNYNNNNGFGGGFGQREGDFRAEDGGFFPQSYNNTSYNIEQLENIPEKHMPVDNKKIGEPVPKTFGSVDFFVLMADKQGKYLAVLNNDDIDEETAQSYITSILGSRNETGVMSSYQFYNAEKSNGTLIALTDKSEETNVLKQFMRMTVIIGSATLVVLSFMAYYLSKKSIEPIKTAFEKQKQFISDASHELKTPLTVISANADVLSGEIGENKWLNYIKSQTERMNMLVNDLLNLTRLENNTSDFIRTDFNLSQAITNTALPFECRAFDDNKKFIVDVEDGLTVNGSEKHIKQMTAIFIDNALKYSNDGGMVKVRLKSQGDRKILSVYNTGTGIKEDEKDKIFERFYRSDDSRSRQNVGGYGLGLAIAKSVIDKHKFKVAVENDEGKSICFIVTM